MLSNLPPLFIFELPTEKVQLAQSIHSTTTKPYVISSPAEGCVWAPRERDKSSRKACGGSGGSSDLTPRTPQSTCTHHACCRLGRWHRYQGAQMLRDGIVLLAPVVGDIVSHDLVPMDMGHKG